MNHNFVRDSTGLYTTVQPVTPDDIVEMSENILRKRIEDRGPAFCNPKLAAQWMVAKMSLLEHEVFSVLFLDNQHKYLAFEEMFRGSLTHAEVHPREIVKRALFHNAAAVFLVHNHPSGNPEPSSADIELTKRLKSALSIMEIRILDHFVVGGSTATSMNELNLI